MLGSSTFAPLLLALSPSVLATTYSITDTYVGPSFLAGFDHIAVPDPTHGRVNYTDQNFAVAHNLTYAQGNTFIIRADYTTVLSPSGPGRNSVRVQSKKKYTTGVTIADVRHMPEGCGTWPAFWTSDANDWPNQGEIDIIEGVNDQSPNYSTLHTTAGCTQNGANMVQTSTLSTTDCYWADNGNAGCGVSNNKANGYGPGFNSAGGGWYVMERTDHAINIWFWSRNDASVPSDVKNGASSVDTSKWGTPLANFVDNSCDFSTHFGPENIIINLTLCGDWAGAVYPSTCPKTCVDHVNQDPADFKNSYWDFAGLRVYTTATGGSGPTNPTGWTYQGCVLDSASRTLTGPVYTDPAMTVEMCESKCAGYTYAGIEYGTECYCGNTLTQNTATNTCTMPCGGSSSETCGGSWGLSLYKAGGSSSSGSWAYQGCYLDQAQPRTLTGPEYTDAAAMTPAECQSKCAGYTYAGIEYGSECYCGNTLTAATTNTCTFTCPGDNSQTCGGSWGLSVWKKS